MWYTLTRKGYEGMRKDVQKCLRNAHLLKVCHRLCHVLRPFDLRMQRQASEAGTMTIAMSGSQCRDRHVRSGLSIYAAPS